ncbi:MAG: hypothetical protein R6U21_05540, partial [Thermoplasmatota archaeon]
HPLDTSMIIPLFLSIVFSTASILLLNSIFMISLWILPIILLLFYVFVFLSLLLSKNVKKEDIQMISLIAKKFHLNAAKTTVFLNKYSK